MKTSKAIIAGAAVAELINWLSRCAGLCYEHAELCRRLAPDNG
jgi:hypothetical protein